MHGSCAHPLSRHPRPRSGTQGTGAATHTNTRKAKRRGFPPTAIPDPPQFVIPDSDRGPRGRARQPPQPPYHQPPPLTTTIVPAPTTVVPDSSLVIPDPDRGPRGRARQPPQPPYHQPPPLTTTIVPAPTTVIPDSSLVIPDPDREPTCRANLRTALNGKQPARDVPIEYISLTHTKSCH